MSTDRLIPFAGGAASAILFVAFLSGVQGTLLLAYFSLLPLFAVAFGWGIRAGNIAAVSGALLAFVFGRLAGGVPFIILVAVPVGLVIQRALLGQKLKGGGVNWYPIGHILCHLAAVGGAFLAIAATMHFDVEGGFRAAMGHYLDLVLSNRLDAGDHAIRKAIVESIMPLLPGSIVGSWILMIVVNATLAQGILVRMEKNRRPSPEYTRIDLPEWISWAFVGAAAASLATSGSFEYFARNLTMVFAIPFFFAGLAFLHLMARRLPVPGLALGALYIVLLFSTWMLAVVAAVGALDAWMDLRARFVPGGGGQSNLPAPADEDEDEKNGTR
jgi:hypothetical protein